MDQTPSEIYLVVDNARSQALTRAWDRFDDAAIGSVDLYFRSSTGVALVAVHLRGGRDRGRWIGQIVAAGVAVIDPARMGAGDRRAFFATYLQSYQLIARGGATIAGVMAALRSAANRNARGTGPHEPIVDHDEVEHDEDDRPLVDVEQRRAQVEATPAPLPPVPAAGTASDAGSRAHHPPPTPPLPPAPPARRERRDQMRGTALGLGAVRQPSGGVPSPEESYGHSVPTVEYRGRDTEPLAPMPSPPSPTPSVHVRFLRGGQWSPARLRSLSARGAYLVTGAPPRIGDDVHVALELGELSVIVRGGVYHVTTARDAAETGSSGFAVRFPSDPGPTRDRLVELLQEARARGVVIKPPPSRQAVRFPVRWPVELRGNDGTYGDVLDVSLGGLFISPQSPLRDHIVTAVVPIDVGDPPIELRARIARAVTSADATARGLTAGYGLEIVDMSESDRVRWHRFLGRVERRSGKSVLVGAAPRRLEQIGRALADAGYAVTSSADPGALVRLADGPSMPDVAVIDESLLEQGVSATWLEQMFTQRQVPCITIRGEAVRARMVVDRLLAVAAS